MTEFCLVSFPYQAVRRLLVLGAFSSVRAIIINTLPTTTVRYKKPRGSLNGRIAQGRLKENVGRLFYFSSTPSNSAQFITNTSILTLTLTGELLLRNYIEFLVCLSSSAGSISTYLAPLRASFHFNNAFCYYLLASLFYVLIMFYKQNLVVPSFSLSRL